MLKHTPGPWEARLLEDPQWMVGIKGEAFHAVCVTSQGNDEANARLIAAAPDLLAACKDLAAGRGRHTVREQAQWGDSLERAYAAIAKATCDTPDKGESK